MKYLYLMLLILSLACTTEANSNEIDVSAGGELKEFVMQAQQFEFIPGEIKVQQGDTVRLKITSTDVTHGFQLSQFNINENLPPNQEVTIEFVADKKGTYTFGCSVYCGVGHPNMAGKLVVE